MDEQVKKKTMDAEMDRWTEEQSTIYRVLSFVKVSKKYNRVILGVVSSPLERSNKLMKNQIILKNIQMITQTLVI